MAQTELRQVTMAASGTADLMSIDASTGFKSRLTPLRDPSQVSIAIISTDANVQMEVATGPETVVPTSPVPSGGTIGQFPKIPDDVYISFEGQELDEISVPLRNTGAGTPSVMAAISVEPL